MTVFPSIRRCSAAWSYFLKDASVRSGFAALELFDPVWEVLYPIERARILRLLIEQIDFNAGTGKIGITFHPTGIAALYEEMTAAQQLAAGQLEEAYA